MNYKRGDVVLVLFPNSDLKTAKKRPALIIQSNKLKTELPQTLIALVTSNLQRTGPSRIPIKKDSGDGQLMGLLTDSVIVADNLATVLHKEVDKVIGHCPNMSEIDRALKKVLDL